jgi:hypothetical protein
MLPQQDQNSNQDEKNVDGSDHSSASSRSELGKLPARTSGKFPFMAKPLKGVDSTLYLNGARRRSSISVADTINAINSLNNPHAHVSSLQEGRRAILSTLTIVDKSANTGHIENKSLLELLHGIEDNIKHSIDGVSLHLVTDRDGIGELRGRDLCRLTKFGNDSDSLVYLVKQHCLIVSFRYDMRAVIESNRITFVAHEGEHASLERIRSFMLGENLPPLLVFENNLEVFTVYRCSEP